MSIQTFANPRLLQENALFTLSAPPTALITGPSRTPPPIASLEPLHIRPLVRQLVRGEKKLLTAPQSDVRMEN